MAEYWRKLYVGMTRAEDELYVTGTLGANDQAGGHLVRRRRAALGGSTVRLRIAPGPEARLFPPPRPQPMRSVAADGIGLVPAADAPRVTALAVGAAAPPGAC